MDKAHKNFFQFVYSNIGKGKIQKEYARMIYEEVFLDLAGRPSGADRDFSDPAGHGLLNYLKCLIAIWEKERHETISVCIKIVEEHQSDYNENRVRTLIRSEETRRKDNESCDIGQNTGLMNIGTGINHFYGNGNLVQSYYDGTYKNPDEFPVWSDKYNSTLVIPLGYRMVKVNATPGWLVSEMLSSHGTLMNEYLTDSVIDIRCGLLGFLCIDSQTIHPEWDGVQWCLADVRGEQVFELGLLSIFATLLHAVLHPHL